MDADLSFYLIATFEAVAGQIKYVYLRVVRYRNALVTDSNKIERVVVVFLVPTRHHFGDKRLSSKKQNRPEEGLMITSGGFVSVAVIVLLLGCSGSDNSAAPSTMMNPGASPAISFAQGSGFDALVRSIVLTDDGSRDIYVGGDFARYNGTTSRGLIRLHPDGTVANTFGFDGYVAGIALAGTGNCELYVLGEFVQFSAFQRTSGTPARSSDSDRGARSGVPPPGCIRPILDCPVG